VHDRAAARPVDDVDDASQEGLVGVTRDDPRAGTDSVRLGGSVEERPHVARGVELLDVGGQRHGDGAFLVHCCLPTKCGFLLASPSTSSRCRTCASSDAGARRCSAARRSWAAAGTWRPPVTRRSSRRSGSGSVPQPAPGEDGVNRPVPYGDLGGDGNERRAVPREAAAGCVGVSEHPVDGERPPSDDDVRVRIEPVVRAQVLLDGIELGPVAVEPVRSIGSTDPSGAVPAARGIWSSRSATLSAWPGMRCP